MPLAPDASALRERLAGLPVRKYQAGENVLTAGSTTGKLLVLRSGAVEVVKDGEQIAKVSAPGAVFGELALLDRGPRSATITVDQDLAGFGLSEASFGELCQKQPDIAIKLLSALGRELSVRIRYANMTIQQLES